VVTKPLSEVKVFDASDVLLALGSSARAASPLTEQSNRPCTHRPGFRCTSVSSRGGPVAHTFVLSTDRYLPTSSVRFSIFRTHSAVAVDLAALAAADEAD